MSEIGFVAPGILKMCPKTGTYISAPEANIRNENETRGEQIVL